MRKRAVIVLLTLIMALVLTTVASAMLVIPTVTETSGIWTYNYTVENSYLSDETVWLFAVDVGADVFDILSPANWYIWQDGTTGVVEWDSEYDPSYIYDIWPGNSLSGFSFQSNYGPGNLGYKIQGWDITNDDYGSINLGSTLAPVPEPSTLWLLTTGLVGVIGIGRRKFKRRNA